MPASLRAACNVGGITSRIQGGSDSQAVISRCYNAGTVTAGANNYAGGIAGYLYHADLLECYNTGSISANRAAGIAAQATTGDTVTACYNVGAVSVVEEGSYNYIGAIIAYNGGATLTRCYHLSGGLEGVGSGSGTSTACTAEEMQSLETVLGLGGSFVQDAKNQNGGYPVLAWQDPDAKLIVAFSINVSGAAVTVMDASGTVMTPEADGTYRLTSGSYTYTVTKEECDDVTGSFTVDGAGMTIQITLQVRTYPLNLTVSPADAAVVIRDSAGQTMEAGDEGYRLPKGQYTYEVSKFGYVGQSGNLTITGEKTA